MGRRMHLAECLDCKEKYGGDPDVERKEITGGYYQPSHFYIKMQHMTREELLNHLEEITCPVCESKNWRITDYSRI